MRRTRIDESKEGKKAWMGNYRWKMKKRIKDDKKA